MSPVPETVGQEQNINLLTMLFLLVFAGFGGAVKYVSSVIRSSDTVSHRRFVVLLLANTFISSFCGLMGGLLVTTFTEDKTWHYLACGLFGYMGTQGLDIILLALKKKISIEPSPVSAVVPIPPAIDPSIEK